MIRAIFKDKKDHKTIIVMAEQLYNSDDRFYIAENNADGVWMLTRNIDDATMLMIAQTGVANFINEEFEYSTDEVIETTGPIKVSSPVIGAKAVVIE